MNTLTFADEALLGDGLLAYITALGLLEWLQLEGVCVDALQLVGLWEEEEERDVELMPSRSSARRNMIGIQPRNVAAHGGLVSAGGSRSPVHLWLCFPFSIISHSN